jgi:hypothetical protein
MATPKTPAATKKPTKRAAKKATKAAVTVEMAPPPTAPPAEAPGIMQEGRVWGLFVPPATLREHQPTLDIVGGPLQSFCKPTAWGHGGVIKPHVGVVSDPTGFGRSMVAASTGRSITIEWTEEFIKSLQSAQDTLVYSTLTEVLKQPKYATIAGNKELVQRIKGTCKTGDVPDVSSLLSPQTGITILAYTGTNDGTRRRAIDDSSGLILPVMVVGDTEHVYLVKPLFTYVSSDSVKFTNRLAFMRAINQVLVPPQNANIPYSMVRKVMEPYLPSLEIAAISAVKVPISLYAAVAPNKLSGMSVAAFDTDDNVYARPSVGRLSCSHSRGVRNIIADGEKFVNFIRSGAATDIGQTLWNFTCSVMSRLLAMQSEKDFHIPNVAIMSTLPAVKIPPLKEGQDGNKILTELCNVLDPAKGIVLANSQPPKPAPDTFRVAEKGISQTYHTFLI